MKSGVLLLFLALTGPAPAIEGINDAFPAKALPAIVSLYSVGTDERHATSRGVGFLVSSDGILVTARHVSEANAALYAFTADGRKHTVTGFYGADRDYDVAVLKIAGEDFPHLELAKSGLPGPEEWVAVVSPEPNHATIYATGSVKVVLSVPNVWDVICTTIPVHPGQSGSPLLNARAEVVGIVCGNDNKPEDGYAGYAMPAGIVREILTRGGSKAMPFAKRKRQGSSLPLAFDTDFRAAAEQMGSNDWSAAEERLKAAGRRFPESPLVLFCLGLCKAKRQDWKEAERAMAKVVELKSESGLAWCVYGASLVARGKHKQAEVALRTSIRLRPPDPALLFSAWELIAQIEAERGNASGVRSALNELGQIDSTKAEICWREIRQNYPKLNLSEAGPPVKGDRP